MFGDIILMLFLFPFIYFIWVIIAAVYMTGGIFPTLFVFLVIGIFVWYIGLYVQAMKVPKYRNITRQRNKQEKKDANEWGIIDYFDKDK